MELQNCPFFISERLGESYVNQRAAAIVEESYKYLTNLTLAQNNHDYCKIEGAKPEDYLYRNLTMPLGEIITSIRFMGGDLKKPFVLVVHKDFEINTPSDIWQLNAFLTNEYALFKPKHIQWFSKKTESELIEKNDFLSGDMVYISELLDVLQEKEKPANYDKIRLKLAKNTKWFDKYEAVYKTMFKNNPAFIEMAQITAKATFNEMIKDKLLYEIFVEKEWAGVIGVKAESDSFFSGYCVYEELLIDEFRGKKLAAAVQRNLVEKLPNDANKMLYGTIHYDNIPSLKTAERVGRSACGMYVMAKV